MEKKFNQKLNDIFALFVCFWFKSVYYHNSNKLNNWIAKSWNSDHILECTTWFNNSFGLFIYIIIIIVVYFISKSTMDTSCEENSLQR